MIWFKNRKKAEAKISQAKQKNNLPPEKEGVKIQLPNRKIKRWFNSAIAKYLKQTYKWKYSNKSKRTRIAEMILKNLNINIMV